MHHSSLLGKHGAKNTTAALIMATLLCWPVSKIRQSTRTFQGMKKRTSLVSGRGGIKFFSDYGHHPTEIRTVLDHLRGNSTGKLIVVFEPHRASRVELLFSDFCECFDGADQVIVFTVYSPEDDTRNKSLQRKLKKGISLSSRASTSCVGSIDNLVLKMRNLSLENGDVVVFFSAGPLSNQVEEVVERATSVG